MLPGKARQRTRISVDRFPWRPIRAAELGRQAARINNDMPGISATLAALAYLSLTTPTADAAERWFLMSRHGDCTNVAVLKRKVPDLGDISDPDGFARFMRQKGYDVTSRRISVPKGQAQEVDVPQKELFLIFVTAAMCRGPQTR